MANSKDESKPRKIIDVAKPGKTAPPSSAKPIIVTNRPMLRRDPMMAPVPGDTAESEPASKDKPISRVGKTIKIMPLADDVSAPEAPKGKEAPKIDDLIKAKQAAKAEPAPESAVPAVPHVVEPAVALEVGQEVLASLDAPETDTNVESTMPPTDELTIEPSVEPEQVQAPHSAVAITVTEADRPAPEMPTEETTPEIPKDDTSAAAPAVEEATGQVPATGTAEPPANVPSETVAEDATSTTPEPSSDSDEAVAAPETEMATAEDQNATAGETSTDETATTDNTVASSSNTDTQLAPNEIHADAKRKVDSAAAERQLEIEKIINSKQYHLPIAAHEKNRGTLRSLLILVLVIVLAIIWLDIVLDAGIVHIPGVQALTHFFSE